MPQGRAPPEGPMGTVVAAAGGGLHGTVRLVVYVTDVAAIARL
jgi:hypothetical protein